MVIDEIFQGNYKQLYVMVIPSAIPVVPFMTVKSHWIVIACGSALIIKEIMHRFVQSMAVNLNVHLGITPVMILSIGN